MHRGSVTETTLIMWRSLGVFDLHKGGREGEECIYGDVFLLTWTSLAVGVVDGALVFLSVGRLVILVVVTCISGVLSWPLCFL
jgi:hypothetical protein